MPRVIENLLHCTLPILVSMLIHLLRGHEASDSLPIAVVHRVLENLLRCATQISIVVSITSLCSNIVWRNAAEGQFRRCVLCDCLTPL